MCQCFLNISSPFQQHRDNIDNHDNLSHYNCDKKFVYVTSLLQTHIDLL